MQVAVNDDDTAGVTFAPAALIITEGDQDTYTVVLDTQPAHDVAITSTSRDEGVAILSPATLIFSPDNWNTPQAVLVAAAHDDDAYDESTTIAHDVRGYDHITTADEVTVACPDDDTAGVTVAPTALTINEGDQDTYTVVLDTQPAHDVTITTTSGDASVATVRPTALTFTTDNWNQPQTITATGIEDDDAYNESILITHTVSGYDHVTTAETVQVAVNDDDTAGVTVAPTALTINEGDQSTYTVVLTSQQAAKVIVTATSSNASIATVRPATLTFAPDNWNTPQTITVAATHDDDAYDERATITHVVSGYGDVTTADKVQVAVEDDDTAGVTVAPTALTINEGDQSAYTVVLDSRPSTDVTITPTSSNASIATVRPATLTFTPDSWNQPQTITVATAHDDDAYDASTTITHAVSGYGNVTTAATVQITVEDDDTAGVTVAPTALTVNEGNESAYTVVLDSRPSTDVTITPTSGEAGVASVSPAKMTFTPDDWNTPQTITIAATHDDDAYDERATITHDVSGYGDVTTADNVQVAVEDDDTAGVSVAPTTLTIAEGDQSAYTVVLDSRPSTDVTITPTSDAASVATVRPTALTFTTDNWNQPQTITVTATHDDDAYDASTAITHAVNGYDHVTTAETVQITVLDDDTAGVTVAPTALTVNEGDQSAYTVVLNTQPANNVTITPASHDAGVASVSPATLTFTPHDWNTPQTITVTATHDDDAYDASTTITHDVSGYDHVTTADEVVVAILDDDTAGVSVAPTALTLNEGNQSAYTVVLNTQPANNVTVTPTSGDANIATVSPAKMTFTPHDWNTPQTITVTAAHDDDAYDASTTITHDVSGYNDVTTAATVHVSVEDDDTAGVSIAPTALTVAEGDQDTYTVVLDTRPSTDVTITPTSGDENIATVSPAKMTFTPHDWNTPQTVTVAATHDDDAYDAGTTITHDVSGYDHVTTADNVQVSVPDDDTAGVSVAPTTLTLNEGDQSTYTVVLDTQPANNVTITPASGDATVATVQPATLTFAPDSWNQPQTVTVTAAHDDDAYDERATITHAVNGYDHVTTADNVQVSVPDDDTPGVTVAPTTLTLNEGDQSAYTVVLDSQPNTDVTITPASDDATVATVQPATLTFAPDNWNQPQTITVAAAHDDDAYDANTTITHDVSGYDHVTKADNVQIAVPDDDTPGATIAPTTLTIAEGNESTYTVVLDTRPAANVTITPTSGDAGVATVQPATLTFAPDNWNTLQTITVAATHDDDAYDERATITHDVNGYDHVTTADNVQVSIPDDDTAGVTIAPTALTINEGDQSTYTVVLNTQPANNVTITPASGDATVATVQPATLTFAPDNWNTPQTITVAAAHDDDAYDASAAITHAVSGYDHVTTADNVQVSIPDDDTAGVTVAPTALTINEGDQSTYTVVLDTQPATNVTITPASGDATVATVSPEMLTFAPDNWNTPQTITVAAAHDDDAYDASTTITHAIAGYDHVTTAETVHVSISDDDTAAVTVAPTTLTINEGDESAYTVVLNTRPAHDVTITSTSGAASVATVRPTALTFTTDNWNQPQTITIVAPHDDDAYDASTAITHAVNGYDHVTTADNVQVSVPDDDTAGVTVAPTALTITEGDQDTYTVVLDTRPATNVTIIPTSDDASVATVAPTTLTFTPHDWNTPQTITVTAAHDNDAYDESTTITHDVNGYDHVTTAKTVQIAVPDDDTPGATIAPTTLTINEGDESTYTVVLDTQPATNVTITPTSGDENVATVFPATLTFAPDNWNQPQTITVTATHDDDAYDASTTITHDVSGYDHITKADNVQIAVNDDDAAGVTVAPTTLTVTEGDQDTYTVVLNTRPAANVTITPASGDENIATVSPETLTFAPDSWNQPQTITVTATQDDDAYDESVTISHAIADYDDVTTAETVQIAVPDDDTAGVTVAPTVLTINEGDQSAYTVVLDTQPAANVTITSTSGAASVASVSPATLRFTPDDWNTPQTITVTAPHDDDAYDTSTTITHTVSGYDHVTTADNVQVSVADDDTAGVTVAPTALTINEGDQSAYTVVLDTRPAHDVTITTTSGNADVASVSPATLTFAPDNWNTPRTVTVATGEDANADDASTTITHAVSGYDHVTTADNVQVSVPDNDLALDPAMLADLARALADQRVGAIVRRIGRARNGGAGAMASRFSLPADWQDLARALKGNAFNVKDMLGGADLTLPLSDNGTRPPFTLWGGTDYRNLSFRGGPAAWNGDLFTIHMGMSGGLSAHWLAGLATAWSQSELFYRGTGDDADYELNLASVHPYANWTRNGWDAWLTVGYGRGELGVSGQSPARHTATDVNTRTAGGGLSAEVLATGATKLRLKGEALRTELVAVGSAKKGAGIAALTVDASRLRMTVEATRPRILTSGARLAPMLEVGVRYDGGDGQTGTGAELGGGLSYDDPTRRLTAAGNARVLLGRRGHDEWGVQAEFELRPRQDGSGASFSLRPGYGYSASGVQRLYERGLRGPNPRAAPWTAARLNARLGYGLFASGGVLTLAGEMTTTGGAKSYRLRPHWTPDEQLNVELIGERRKRLGSHATHTILLKGIQRF